jgi:hypothetical protein
VEGRFVPCVAPGFNCWLDVCAASRVAAFSPRPHRRAVFGLWHKILPALPAAQTLVINSQVFRWREDGMAVGGTFLVTPSKQCAQRSVGSATGSSTGSLGFGFWERRLSRIQSSSSIIGLWMGSSKGAFSRGMVSRSYSRPATVTAPNGHLIVRFSALPSQPR